jgi:hypothetical protein
MLSFFLNTLVSAATVVPSVEAAKEKIIATEIRAIRILAETFVILFFFIFGFAFLYKLLS